MLRLCWLTLSGRMHRICPRRNQCVVDSGGCQSYKGWQTVPNRIASSCPKHSSVVAVPHLKVGQLTECQSGSIRRILRGPVTVQPTQRIRTNQHQHRPQPTCTCLHLHLHSHLHLHHPSQRRIGAGPRALASSGWAWLGKGRPVTECQLSAASQLASASTFGRVFRSDRKTAASGQA